MGTAHSGLQHFVPCRHVQHLLHQQHTNGYPATNERMLITMRSSKSTRDTVSTLASFSFSSLANVIAQC